MTADRAAELRRQALVDRIVHAVRAAAVAAIDQGEAIDLAVARAAARELGDQAGDDVAYRERPAQRRARQNAEAMRQMDQLDRDGKGRASAAIVARRLAVDPRDPLEVETIAQRLRRRRRKKSEHCSDKPTDQE